MHRFKDLKVWQKVRDLVALVYSLINQFPDKERFGLITQINRSSVSILSNIAGGAGRNSDKKFNNFLEIAIGSSCELETQLVVAGDLDSINQKEKIQTKNSELKTLNQEY